MSNGKIALANYKQKDSSFEKSNCQMGDFNELVINTELTSELEFE